MSGPADMSLRAYQEAALRVFFDPSPSEDDVRIGLEGNLCRCTGYHNIVQAVLSAAGQ